MLELWLLCSAKNVHLNPIFPTIGELFFYFL